jgi:phosphoglycerol transferase MdoB-like AlkP superfamily enzyme
LGQQGYQTSFFHGAPNGSMGFQAFTKLAGFQRYYGRDEFNDDQYFDGIWGIWDEEFFGFFANELNTMTEPFYSTIFSVSSHHPFEVPERYQGVFPKGSLPLHQCIGYTDNALKLFFEQISKMPWFNNTLFVITADHSTMPYHEEYKNNLGAFSIPMIFYTPDGSLISGFNNRLAQQIDIMPSVLSHLKFPFPFVAFGNNLFDEDLPPFVINYIGGNYQFMADGYVLYFDGKKLTGIYDYLKDPSLTQNLINSIDVPQTERLMKAVLQQYNNRMIENRLVYSN